ncbi:MAG TPA: hypothetical protein VN664_11440 [Burkholderiales bacterium]|nr:hypothetical protein [Burkholderiales bacterium]
MMFGYWMLAGWLIVLIVWLMAFAFAYVVLTGRFMGRSHSARELPSEACAPAELLQVECPKTRNEPPGH